MTQSKRIYIIGVGKYLPVKIDNPTALSYCTNVPADVNCAWMEEKIGIQTRYAARDFSEKDGIPLKGNCNSDMGYKAAQEAIKSAGISKNQVDLLIVSTCTPDYPVPSTASIVQDKLGIQECASMDIRSACAGSVQAIITAMQFLSTGYYKTAVVVASELGSVFGNLDLGNDKGHAVNASMIGDGAGAVVLQAFEENGRGIEILYSKMNSIGAGKAPGMYLPGGGSLHPCHSTTVKQNLGWFKHDYRSVLRHGPELYFRGLHDCLGSLKLSLDDIDVFVPHQANGKVPTIADKMGVPKERIFFNFDRYGNTANASLLLCLADLVEEDSLPEGANVLLVAAESTKWLYGVLLLRFSSLKTSPSSRGAVLPRVRSSWLNRLYSSTLLWSISSLLRLKRLVGL